MLFGTQSVFFGARLNMRVFHFSLDIVVTAVMIARDYRLPLRFDG